MTAGKTESRTTRTQTPIEDLARIRSTKAQTVMDILATDSITTEHRQSILCAAVTDVMLIDDALHTARLGRDCKKSGV